jgi:flagellar basal-body rod modification protein FlgD
MTLAPIESIGTALGTTAAASTSSTSSTDATSSNSLNQDTFLKLLVAQLQNQNPDSPTDPTQYLSETAQFTEVQTLQTLQTSMTSLIASQQDASATNMLGKSVTWTDNSGASPVTRTGTVTGVSTTAGNTTGGPELTVVQSGVTGTTPVALSAVTGVADPSTT